MSWARKAAVGSGEAATALGWNGGELLATAACSDFGAEGTGAALLGEEARRGGWVDSQVQRSVPILVTRASVALDSGQRRPYHRVLEVSVPAVDKVIQWGGRGGIPLSRQCFLLISEHETLEVAH